MKNRTYKFIIMGIFFVSLLFLRVNKEQAPGSVELQESKSYVKDGISHSVVEVSKVQELHELSVEIQLEIDSLKDMIAAQNVKIEQLHRVNMQLEQKGKLEMENDSTWRYEDKDTELNINTIEREFKLRKNIDIVQMDYVKKGIFGRKKSYTDVYSTDSNITFNNQKSIRIEHRGKRRIVSPGLHVGYGYMPVHNKGGLVVSVGLNVGI